MRLIVGFFGPNVGRFLAVGMEVAHVVAVTSILHHPYRQKNRDLGSGLSSVTLEAVVAVEKLHHSCFCCNDTKNKRAIYRNNLDKR